jgi:ribosome maturation factor RimP
LGDSGFHGKDQGTRDAGKRSRSGAAVPARQPAGQPVRRTVRPPPPVAVGVRVGWREAIAGTVGGLGYELVDVERAQRGLLRITIDRIAGRAYTPPGDFVTVDDCEQVTRQLQYALEVEGLEYTRLEVSSPGLDRPLKTEDQFERFAGLAVSVTLKVPFEGRKVWQGVLDKADAGGWSLVFRVGKAEQVLAFKFEEVREARLVPVVDFKGRKSNDSGPAGVAPDAVPGTDGG